MSRIHVILLCGLLGLSSSTIAHDAVPPTDQVRLSASAGRDVDTDRVVATLFKEQQSAEQATAADEVNKAIAFGSATAKAAGLEVETTAYRSHPVYRNQRLVGWRVRQVLTIEATDSTALAAVLGVLQSQLSIQSLSHVLSDQRQAEAEDALITEALQAFMRRADLVASTLSRSGHQIVSIDINSASRGGGPVRARAAMLNSEAIAEPAIEGGQQRVEVHVSGTIELNPSQ